MNPTISDPNMPEDELDSTLPAAVTGTWFLGTALLAAAVFAPWLWLTIPSFIIGALLYGSCFHQLAHAHSHAALRVRALEHALFQKVVAGGADPRQK